MSTTLLLQDILGNFDKLIKTTDKMCNLVNGQLSRPLSEKFNKLSLSHIKETFAINRKQNVIDLSSKLSSSELTAISLGFSFAFKSKFTKDDITAKIERTCVNLRKFNEHMKSQNNSTSGQSNIFIKSPFEIPQVIFKKSDDEFESKLSNLKHSILNAYNKKGIQHTLQTKFFNNKQATVKTLSKKKDLIFK